MTHGCRKREKNDSLCLCQNDREKGTNYAFEEDYAMQNHFDRVDVNSEFALTENE